MKTFRSLLAAVLLVVGPFAVSGWALTIGPGDAFPGNLLTNPTGPSNCEEPSTDPNHCVYDFLNIPNDGSLDLIYKANFGGSEAGSLAANYTTVFGEFAGAGTDPSGATITWDGGAFADCPTCVLAIKDGNSTPSYYFYNLAAWDGQETIVLTGFWPGDTKGAISHVSIWGSGTEEEENPPVVPEPASLLLLGSGLTAVAFRARRRTNKGSAE